MPLVLAGRVSLCACTPVQVKLNVQYYTFPRIVYTHSCLCPLESTPVGFGGMFRIMHHIRYTMKCIAHLPTRDIASQNRMIISAHRSSARRCRHTHYHNGEFRGACASQLCLFACAHIQCQYINVVDVHVLSDKHVHGASKRRTHHVFSVRESHDLRTARSHWRIATGPFPHTQTQTVARVRFKAATLAIVRSACAHATSRHTRVRSVHLSGNQMYIRVRRCSVQ